MKKFTKSELDKIAEKMDNEIIQALVRSLAGTHISEVKEKTKSIIFEILEKYSDEGLELSDYQMNKIAEAYATDVETALKQMPLIH